MTAQGNLIFHPLLDSPPKCAGQALTGAAKQFDYSPFRNERTVADKQKPAHALIQKMENTFYRNTYELRKEPFWNVEAKAFEILLANNLTAAQISDGLGSVYSNVHDSEYFRRPRPLHDAFVAVIRNVDADALLLLPNGKTIKPYRLIKQSYDAYHAGLEKHPWVVGSARQQMHEKKLPFLPSVQKAEIKRIAQTLRVPSISTESGTEAADELLGSLPIFAPTLQLARALRDDKSHKLYYVLLIARDVLATAAMGKMIFAAYVTPFITGMRLSASAVLAARMIPGKTITSVRRFSVSVGVGRRSAVDIDKFIELTHLFFGTCYERSPLFRCLFDHGLKRREQQWIIFPDGYAGDNGIEHDILIPSQGIINAAAGNALYLGLMDVEPHPRNASIAVPTSSLRPLEPFRRMLDGVIAALAGADLLLPRTAAFEHRGAVAWASDMILLEAIQDAEMPPNKRLAQIAVSADNAAECKRLRKAAGQRREQARDEDAWLDHWFATVSNMASP